MECGSGDSFGCRDVSFRYDADSALILDKVSVDIRAGFLSLLLGGNGSGKTTLSRLLLGLLTCDSGALFHQTDGLNELVELDWLRKNVYYIFQNPDHQIVGTVVEDDIAFGMENHEIPKEDMLARMEYALRLTGLGGLESRNPVMLSGGQKQRLAIAGAIAAGAKYLIMDEPSSMLDPDGKREMRELLIRLKSEGLGILLISHHPDEIEICDSYYVLDRGNVWFYSDFKQLKASPVYSKLGYDPGESEILELLMGVL